jgi:hypothetical protein
MIQACEATAARGPSGGCPRPGPAYDVAPKVATVEG